MNCEFAERVSLLIDGELPEAEAEKVTAHLENCPECQALEKDFLFFRQQLRESARNESKKYKLPDFRTAGARPLWKKGIVVPVPVFAGLILIIAALSIWTAVSRFNDSGITSAGRRSPQVSLQNPAERADENSLARFDRGKRAEIYVISRSESEGKR